MRLRQTVEGRANQLEGRSPTIAIVDDNDSMLRSIQRLLSIEGFVVETYPSAEAFLARNSGEQLACLVLDIQLPKMSGIELRQRLTATRFDVPIVFITAIEDNAVQQAAVKLGCAAYLRKPFQPEALVAAITDALDGR
jgi:FixJ family two-component response regulator